MLKNVKLFVSVVTTLCVALLLIAPSYAEVISREDISINCSPNSDAASWYEYNNGDQDVTFTLTSKGIKIKGEDPLVLNWGLRDGEAMVSAKCIGQGSNGGVTQMIGQVLNDNFVFDHSPTLRCAPGQGIAVGMFEPNDADPTKYQYQGVLTKEREEEKKQVNSTAKVIMTRDEMRGVLKEALVNAYTTDQSSSAKSQSGSCGGCILM